MPKSLDCDLSLITINSLGSKSQFFTPRYFGVDEIKAKWADYSISSDCNVLRFQMHGMGLSLRTFRARFAYARSMRSSIISPSYS